LGENRVVHWRLFIEKSVGRVQKVVERRADDPGKLSAIRAECDALVGP
jgi:hypothetical protein